MLRKLLENQELLKEELKNIKSLLLNVLGKLDQPAGVASHALIPQLPLETLEDLEKLEDWLKNQANATLLVIFYKQALNLG